MSNTPSSKRDLRLVLVTSDDRTGVQDLLTEQSMDWDDEDGDGETTSAEFTEIGEDGKEGVSIEIDGDEWRELESTGGVTELVGLFRTGMSLLSAMAIVRHE